MLSFEQFCEGQKKKKKKFDPEEWYGSDSPKNDVNKRAFFFFFFMKTPSFEPNSLHFLQYISNNNINNMKAISYEKKNDIEAKLRANTPYRAISRSLNVSLGTVSSIAKNLGIESTNRAGRKSIITTSLGRLLLRSFLVGEYQTAVDAERALRGEGVKISAETIRRFLRSNKFSSKIKKDALPLTPQRKKDRLAWAKKYRHWTVDDWKKVVFSDETKINRLGSDGKQWTWVMEGQALRDHNVNMTYKHGGGSLMLWSCFTQHGPGFIAKIEGGMDSKLYCEILGGDFLNTLQDYRLNVEDVILQQDNDPKHTSKYTNKWLEENGINVLDWPSYSPDMNPIENLWFYLKCQLAAYETAPTSIHQLWERVSEVWYNKVTKEACIKLINSMPKRIEAVIKAKGGATKW
jgi:hypothetical protein